MKNFSASLVVTDLDGTLWDRECWVHPRTAAALVELERRGMPVLAATARRPTSTRHFMDANAVALPAVLLDGSLGRDFAHGYTFHRQSFDVVTASAVLESLLVSGIEPCLNVDGDPRDAFIGRNPSTHPEHLRFLEPWLQLGELQDVVLAEPVLSFLVCGLEQERLLRALAAVGDLAAGSVSRDLTFGGYDLSVRPRGVSKWKGVLAYCQAQNLDPSRVFAVGDGENDVEMLQSAAVACAMADGCEAALAVAQHRIGTASEGGWSEILALIG